MKIALLNPPWPHPSNSMLWGVRAGSRWPHFQPRAAPGQLPRYIPFPFFLGIAARLLADAGHEVLLVDGVAAGIMPDDLYRQLETFQPRLVFMETSTPSLRHDLAIMAEIRRYCPEAKLAAGGTHPAALAAELPGQSTGPDYWLAGEYEQGVTALATALAGDNLPGNLPGLQGHELSDQTCKAVNPDVDSLPVPLYEQLPMQNYSDPVCGLPAPGAQTWLSRGCPFGCTFCVWPQVIYGNRQYRPRRIARALDEVELLISRYGCESFYFDDDTANIGVERMRELSNSIRERGLHQYPWAMMARADCMTPGMLDNLAAAGMYSVKYGVESSSPQLLNACAKGTDWERLTMALRHTRALGIKMHLTFTLGVPGETPDSIRRTMEFALDTAPDTAQFSICTPFPGTVFYDECRKNGWLITDDWDRLLGSSGAVVQTPSLKATELDAGYREALDGWNKFQAERLESRCKALVKRLRRAVSGGRRWRLLGEPDFAGFIFEQAPELTDAIIPGNHDNAGALPDDDVTSLTVIVSPHDEEKIRRRLLRSGMISASMLGLFA